MNVGKFQEIKVCVLIATFNGGEFLNEQLDSIMNQVGNFQVTIIASDDGSKDSTLDILQKFNVKILQGPKLGAAANFSYLVEKSPIFDYYAIADQDDVWFPDKLFCSIEKLQGISGPALYVGTSELSNGKKIEPHKANLHSALVTNHAQGCTFLINNELMQVLREVIKLRILIHDWFVHLVAMLVGQVIYDFKPKMLYRIHANNDTGIPKPSIKLRRLALDLILKGRRSDITLQARNLLDIPGITGEDRMTISRWIDGVQGKFVHRLRFAIFKFTPNLKDSHKFIYASKIVCGTYTFNEKIIKS